MARHAGATLSFIVIVILLLSGCSVSKITASWVDPAFQREQVRSILVLGASQDDLFRRSFEDEMVSQLRQYGMKAVPSYRAISREELPGKEEMEQWIGSQEVDGVLVSRLIETQEETYISPGYISSFGPAGSYWGGRYYPYGGWYDYSAGGYDTIYYPPQSTSYRVYIVETTLYLVASNQPAWSARSEISPEDDLNRAMAEFVAQLVVNMVDRGVL
jgi:hypothetical protein